MEKITITLFTPTANTDDGIKTINYIENRLKPERPTSASELGIYIKKLFYITLIVHLKYDSYYLTVRQTRRGIFQLHFHC